ncbi:MAG: TetR/AcrR family transcriptional regulator [Clostridia bacterium]|nr:TetR/AcrR family transcriptional regulator [Clostridia bacterium]
MVDDKRTRHTEERIEKAMLACLADTSPDKVTVVQLCKAAGINRGTFYAHYTGTLALYNSMERKMTKFLERIVRDVNKNSITYMDAIVYFLENAQKNKEPFLALYKANSQSIKQTLTDAFTDALANKHFPGNSEFKGEKSYAVEFYVNGILSITNTWLREKEPASVDRMARLIYRLTVRE